MHLEKMELQRDSNLPQEDEKTTIYFVIMEG